MSRATDTERVVEFPKREPRKPSSTETIWGKEVLRHGYTAVPWILIRAQRRLGISTTQMNIILQLLDYWVEPMTLPLHQGRRKLESSG